MPYGVLWCAPIIALCAFALDKNRDAEPTIFVDSHGLDMFEFRFSGRPIRFRIQPNLRWRSSTYRSMVMMDDGNLVDQPISDDHNPDQDQHWRLSDQDDNSSGVQHATISSHQSRITALISMNDSVTIHISPERSTSSPSLLQHTIDVYNPNESDRFLQERPQQLSKGEKRIQFKQILSSPVYNCSLTKPTKYVEVLIVNDFSRYDMLANWTTSHTNAIVNIADGYYAAASFESCIRIVLIGQLTFRSGIPKPIIYRPCNTSSSAGDRGCFSCSDDNKCEVTSLRADQYDSTTLLRSFRQWRTVNADVLRQKFGSFDAVHLFSGHDFDGQVRGLAYLDTICKQKLSAVAVIESTTRVPSYHAQIFAHELGHNMGLVHDATRGFIMSPTSSSLTYSTQFSPESKNLMDSMDLFKCFSTVRQMPASNLCGDGIVDPSEECDPGLEQDDCCINCKIDRPRCQCANSELCCESGRFKAANVVCRPSKNSECDQAEVCSGHSAQCPSDIFEPPSSLCHDITGKRSNCFLGTCVPSRDAQCTMVNGLDHLPNASSDGIVSLSSSSRSCPSTKLCSRLHCSSSPSEDCEQVWSSAAANGSPCGPNGPSDTSHVCISGYCVASETANSKSFVCLNQDAACVADDLTVLDTSYWPTIRILIIVMLAVAASVFICCCQRKRPLRGFRRQRSRIQRNSIASSQHMLESSQQPGAVFRIVLTDMDYSRDWDFFKQIIFYEAV